MVCGLTGCTFERDGPPAYHYQEFKSREPAAIRCSSAMPMAARMQSPVNFGPEQVKAIAEVMRKTKKADNAFEERRAVAYAVAWMERYVGDKIGTSARPAGHGFQRLGRPDAAGLRGRGDQHHQLPADPGQ